MAEDLINSLINRPNAQKEIKETIVDLELLQKQLADTANSALTLNTVLGKSTSTKDLSGNISKVNTELEKSVKIRKQMQETIISNSQAEVDAYERSKKGEAGITETVNARNKAEAKLANDATARSGKAIAQQQAQASEYVRAQGLIEKLQIKLKGYKLAQVETTDPRALNIYNQKIQTTEKLIGQLSNVGKDGFDSLGNAVKKSGNAFQAIGQKVVTLARLLPGIGVVGLIAFATGPIIDYITSLDLFGKKITDTQKLMTELNDVNKSAASEYGKQSTKLKILYETATNLNNSYAIRLSATRELKQEFPSTFANLTNEEIMTGKVGRQVKDLTSNLLEQAIARASLNKIQEIAGKQQDVLFQKEKIRIANDNENFNTEIKIRKRLSDAINFQNKQRGNPELSKAQLDKAVSAQLPIYLAENNKSTAKELSEQDKLFNTYQKQIDFFMKNIKPADVEAVLGGGDGGKVEEEAAKKRAAELKRIAEEAYKQQIENEQRALDDRKRSVDAELELLDKAAKDEEELRKKNFEDSNNFLSGQNSKRLLDIEKQRSDELALLADRYEKGLETTETYANKKSDIEDKSNLASTQSAIDLAGELIQLQESYSKDIGSEEEKLARLQIKLSELVTGKKIADADKVTARQVELNAKIKELAEEAAQFVITLVDAGFENRKNKLQEEANAIDDNTKLQIEQVQRSVGTEQEKADKISVINAKAQADKNKIAQQQKRIDIEKAKFDKAIAIARIIENTAIGITSALGSLPPNVPLAFVIGAIGAIQLATAIATPIPTYKDGTESHKGGWAIFGEAGTEYVKEPGKAGYLTQGATLAPLPVGTQVISNADLMSAMANPNSGSSYVSNQLDLSAMINESRNSTREIVKALEIKQSANYLRGRRDEKKFSSYLKRNIN